MKHLLFISFFLLCTVSITAQDREAHREKIKALKTAYITEGLNLTAKEAQTFWPVYNAYEEKRRTLYRREHEDVGNLECLTEESANSKLEEYVEIEREDFMLRKKYYEDLKKIFSAKKILQLEKVEDEFNEKLMREYRARRQKSEN
ncbi:MAG: hypothetical protein WBL21_08745 [Salinimicrobium sp.]